jgi:hypothetical protein
MPDIPNKRFSAAGFASLELLIFMFAIALVWFLLTPIVEYFYQLALTNTTPDAWGVLGLIMKIYKVFPILMLFGAIIWFYLAVQRREVTSGGVP